MPGATFPAFLKLEHQRDGSAQASFLAELAGALGPAESRIKLFRKTAEQEFTAASGEIGRMLDKSLAGFKGGQFGLKLDIPGLKQAAADAEFAKQRLIAMRDAAVSLAASTGDTSRDTQLYIQALRDQVFEADRAADAANVQVVTYSRLQGELDKTVAANEKLAESYRRVEIARGATNASTGPRGPDLRFGVEKLLAGQASIDRAALSATTLEQVLSRVSRGYTEVGVAADGAAQAAKRGTEANHLVVNSTRSLRLATLQAGQQLQDVAISLYSGQRASIVFAQQLPQLAFALTGLEGSANKTHNAIGRIATFLSGPWGLAVGLAIGVAASYAAELLGMGEEAEKAEKRHRSLDEVLRDETASLKELTEATREYTEQVAKAREIEILALQERAASIASNLKEAISIREKLAADLAYYEQITRRGAQSEAQDRVREGAFARADRARESIAANQEKLDALQAAAGAVRLEVADAVAKLQSEPQAKIKTGFDLLREEARATIKDVDALGAHLAALNKQETAAIEALQRSAKARRSGVSSADTDALGSITALIKQLFPGSTITSTTGGRHKKGSDHPLGRAVDFVLGGASKGLSTDEVERRLEEAGVDIRYGRTGTKQLFGPGRPAEKPGDHDDHFHLGFNGAPDPEQIGKRLADAATRAQEKLKTFGEQSSAAVSRINDQFDEQPRLVDQAAKAVGDLDALIKELGERKPPGFEALIADAQRAQALAASAVDRAIGKQIADQRRALEIQALALSGREQEAAVLDALVRAQEQYGTLTEAQRAKIAANTAALHDQNEALEQARDRAQAYLDATREVRGTIEGIIAGEGKLGDFVRTFRRLQARVITEKLFGDVFRDLDKAILRNSGIDAAVDKLETDTTAAANALLRFARVADNATAIMQGRNPAPILGGSGVASPAQRAELGAIFDAVVGSLGGLGGGIAGAANDNPNEIVVTGRRLPRDSVAGMTPASYGELIANALARPLLKGLDQLIPGLSRVIGGALGGYVTGGIPGGVIGALKGIKGLPEAVDKLLGSANVLGKAAEGAATGTAVAGIAKALGLKTSTTGAQIGGAIGSALPIPGGQIIGAIAGGLLGGLFKKTKTGTATIGGLDGALGVTGSAGSSRKFREAAGGAADSVIASVQRIADALGGTVDASRGAVSIGIRGGKYRLDPTGRGITKTGKGAIDFGKDGAEAAARAAALDLIRDGVITGLRAGTQRLLQQGKELDAALQKAVDFESVFTRLKAINDPVGAALDTLDKEFTRLKSIFAEAGASTEEYAQLEQLYGKERAAAVRQATEAIAGSLKSLIDDLTIGNDALSLRDRKTAALARYDPLKARVAAGDTSAFDDFSAAARALIEIERQLSGSQSGYFGLLDEVRGLSQAALDRTTAVADAPASRDSPFTNSAIPTSSSVLVDAVNSQSELLAAQLGAVNDNLRTLILQGGLGGAAAPQLGVLSERGFF